MQEKIAVFFCSASYTIDEKYNQAAREIVRTACLHGYSISSGGTVKGTMRVVADAANEFGARNIGVIPRFMKELVYPDLSQTIWTDTMSERKEKMREGTCLAVALPGGIGTMDELVETLTLAKLGIYDGKIIAFNLDGFYDDFKVLLDHFVEKEMLDARSRALISFPETVEEFEKLI